VRGHVRAFESGDMSPQSKICLRNPLVFIRVHSWSVLLAMKISLNGESVDTREAKTIADLIDGYQLPPQSVLVEHNGLAVHRHEWPKRSLAEGDRVEFVRVVAGG
jgi:sulfur carrier protein